MTVKPLSRPPATATETIVQTGVGHPNGATDRPHAASAVELAQGLRTDLDRGLGGQEAALRLARYGPNRPERVRRPPYVRLALNQLLDPLVALLVAAAAISIAIGETTEGIAIAAILVLNAALGFWQEAAAERAILALSEASRRPPSWCATASSARSRPRTSCRATFSSSRAGERVAADARLVEASSLEVDESALTGRVAAGREGDRASRPRCAARRAHVDDLRRHRCHSRRGQGARRRAPAPRTELGAIERLAAEAKPPPTPLDAAARASRPRRWSSPGS